jgi:hypothetical protein
MPAAARSDASLRGPRLVRASITLAATKRTAENSLEATGLSRGGSRLLLTAKPLKTKAKKRETPPHKAVASAREVSSW